MKVFKLTMIVLFLGVLTAYADDFAKSKFDGTWDYTADKAPDGYRKGTITINGSELQLVIGGYQKYSGQEVKLEKDELSFYTYVEGNRVSVKLTVKDDSVTGVASTPDGNIPLKLTKKK